MVRPAFALGIPQVIPLQPVLGGPDQRLAKPAAEGTWLASDFKLRQVFQHLHQRLLNNVLRIVRCQAQCRLALSHQIKERTRERTDRPLWDPERWHLESACAAWTPVRIGLRKN